MAFRAVAGGASFPGEAGPTVPPGQALTFDAKEQNEVKSAFVAAQAGLAHPASRCESIGLDEVSASSDGTIASTPGA
eukprot:CAMPEP_0174748492 /NCGR_PEP_ID=MMETSP1094-20130205/93611_1 /TAXON_ID=156173 /ORGANISM="Chrysochromulina brevifilum, Strain UTEX LB 985" /LENGTH=76 /DNA_ID=CAMNT_0015953539 /DNA_START=635 /DNA_END=862 /DNA_ORIENTATION=+